MVGPVPQTPAPLFLQKLQDWLLNESVQKQRSAELALSAAPTSRSHKRITRNMRELSLARDIASKVEPKVNE
jgi:hypothetical protein